MIEIKNVTFSYKNSQHKALDDVSLEIRDGDFVGILGGSGAGKTTLTRIINGVIPHNYAGDFYGSVTVDGRDTFSVRPAELARLIGSVLNDIDAQMVTSVVEDEILFGLESFGVPRSEIPGRIDDALREIGIEDLRNRAISTLSGGQKQKAAIAAITALKPKVLLLDEPTGELDPQSSRSIFSMLRRMNEELGITVIIVEQKIMLMSEFAKRLVVINDGRVAYDDSVRGVLAHADELEKMGVNCPRVVTLSNRLRAEGLYNGEISINVDEAEKMIGSI